MKAIRIERKRTILLSKHIRAHPDARWSAELEASENLENSAEFTATGASYQEAVSNLLVMLSGTGFSGDRDDYEVSVKTSPISVGGSDNNSIRFVVPVIIRSGEGR